MFCSSSSHIRNACQYCKDEAKYHANSVYVSVYVNKLLNNILLPYNVHLLRTDILNIGIYVFPWSMYCIWVAKTRHALHFRGFCLSQEITIQELWNDRWYYSKNLKSKSQQDSKKIWIWLKLRYFWWKT